MTMGERRGLWHFETVSMCKHSPPPTPTPPPAGLHFHLDGHGVPWGVGLVTTWAKRRGGCAAAPPRKQRDAVRLWNATAAAFAMSPAVLRAAGVEGGFRQVLEAAGKFLIRIGMPLQHDGHNLLKRLAAAMAKRGNVKVGAKRRRAANGGACGDGAIVSYAEFVRHTATQFAVLYHAAQLFPDALLPQDVSEEAVALDCERGTDAFLDLMERQAAAGGSYLHPSLGVLAPSQVALLCLLLSTYRRLADEAAKKRRAAGLEEHDPAAAYLQSLCDDRISLVPDRCLAAYTAALEDMHSLPPSCPPSFLLEQDLAQLIHHGLVAPASSRAAARVSAAGVRLRIDRVTVLQYLRAQRELQSAAALPPEVVNLLNLDEDISLL
eukprot:TRINITY_DN12962_c0_g1_i2.p1 TRINITY_DN12962_c0_g1~~TRINITY_DN12962_c0_g1_i2.p1  ORF type:complete len:379 (+),score=135.71 TRINITY_DN12962_c0_g1_i2:93-1229(+)